MTCKVCPVLFVSSYYFSSKVEPNETSSRATHAPEPKFFRFERIVDIFVSRARVLAD